MIVAVTTSIKHKKVVGCSHVACEQGGGKNGKHVNFKLGFGAKARPSAFGKTGKSCVTRGHFP